MTPFRWRFGKPSWPFWRGEEEARGAHLENLVLGDLLAWRDYPIEIAETASMGMELLGLEHLDPREIVRGLRDRRRTEEDHARNSEGRRNVARAGIVRAVARVRPLICIKG